MSPSELDLRHMRRALELAARGQGFVEPNPMVGCVIAHGETVVGQGWHRRYGQPHAEVEALAAAGPAARDATLYVTLEPCSHVGKTPPCTDAILAAGIRRVVAAHADPFPQVAGRGFEILRSAGIEVHVGLLEAEARALNAPYLKLLARGRPWMIAKWAMTLDGKIASRTGDSRWISGEPARQLVHELRGRVDAILIGRGTALADDPLLTARPSGPRTATRVVVDTRAALPNSRQLVQTAREVPLLVAVGPEAASADRRRLESAGGEVMVCPGATHAERLGQLLDELGRRRWTNVLVEGGGELLGSVLEAGEIDEVHAFIAPKLLGGRAAATPVGGEGLARVADALRLQGMEWRQLGDDLYVRARLRGGEW